MTPSPFYFAHILLATKGWEPTITKQLEIAIKGRLERNLEIRNCELIAAGGSFEHIHILGKFTSTKPLHRILGWSKGECSHWLNKSNPELNFYWQRGYWHEIVAENELEKVKEYIKNQQNLHESLSFNEEVEMFRKRSYTSKK